MSTSWSVQVNGALTNPWDQANTGVSLLKVSEFFKRCASGEVLAPITLNVTAAPVNATGTVTFSAAPSAADTVTIKGQALTATQQNATGTATFSTIVAGNSVTINSVTFTASATPTGAFQFLVTGGDTAAAAALAAAVNLYAAVTPAFGVGATSAAAVVTFRATATGTGGNAIPLTKVGSPISVSAATLTGGAAVANNQWDPGATAAQAAANLAACIAASVTAAVQTVAATVAAGVVTLTATVPGSVGNVTLTKSGSNIAVSGATLTGGSVGAVYSLQF